MLTPIRSFTLLHGFWLSILATTMAFAPAITLLRRTKGVCPISSVTSFAIFIAISRKRSLGALGYPLVLSEASSATARDNNSNNSIPIGGRQFRGQSVRFWGCGT